MIITPVLAQIVAQIVYHVILQLIVTNANQDFINSITQLLLIMDRNQHRVFPAVPYKHFKIIKLSNVKVVFTDFMDVLNVIIQITCIYFLI